MKQKSAYININNIFARARASAIIFVYAFVLANSTGLIAASKNHKTVQSKKIWTKSEIETRRQTEKSGVERYRLNRLLAQSGLSEGGMALLGSLQSDPDAFVRKGAALSLGNYTQNPAVVRALADALKTETDKPVKLACLFSLSVLPSFQGMKALEKFSTDPDPDFRRQAAFGLKRQKSARADTILKKLEKDSDPSVRTMAGSR